MYLKSGGVSAVLSGVMLSMSRLLEKQGPTLYSPECIEGEFSEVGPHRTTELAVDLYFRLAVDRGVKRDHHPDGRAGVRPYLGTIKLEY